MPTKPPTVRVSLGFKQDKIAVVITGSTAIHDGLAAHPTVFVSPIVVLAVLLAQINALSAAEQAMKTHANTAKPARAAALKTLWSSLKSIVAYVQVLCDGDPENAVLIAKSANLHIIESTAHAKDVIGTDAGSVSGSLDIDLNVGLLGGDTSKNKFFEVQYSRDNGVTWVDCGRSGNSKLTVTGLPTLVNLLLRARVVIGDTPEAWSAFVPVVVH